jgi:hypothetical protein
MSEDVNTIKERSSRGTIRELIFQYIQTKPRRISLKLDWENKNSSIRINGDSLDKTAEYSGAIDFTSFAHGVLEAYREAYGDLEVVPISFREEIYKNDKVALDLYPTGSAGIFDIFIEYKEKQNGRIDFREQSLERGRAS